MIKKLQIKIVALVVTICLLLLVVVLTFVFNATREDMMQDPVSSMEWVIQDIETDIYYGVPKGAPRPMAILFQEDGGTPQLSAHWNMDNVATTEELPALAQALLELKDPQGFYTTAGDDYLAYRWEQLSDGRMVIIMADVSMNRNVLQTFQKNAFLAAGSALLIMILLSILFARWVTKPIAQAQENQQNFFAAASHDLKTPLTIILSNISLLLDAPDGEPLRDQYYSNIQSSAAQMKTLIQNMLDNISFENMANDHCWSTEAPVNFAYLVQKSIFSFEALYFEENRSLRYDLEQDLYTCGNASALERLMGILLDNALKYSNEQSEIYVQLKSIHAGMMQLNIQNEFQPISKDEVTKIFQPFYRVDKSRSDHSSYGLGLSIAKNIVTAHKGAIWVTTEGQKNIFHVTLPRVSAP